MSPHASGRWLRCYPRAWRDRYGEELQELIVATSGNGALPMRVRLDLARGGMRERLRSVGFGSGIPPAERARAGTLLVLCAWAVMLVGGGVLQRFSENWREVTPLADRGLPGVAYDALIFAAALAGIAVLAGMALALPRLVALLRGGGWRDLRAPIGRALEATALAIVATVAIMIWAHGLDSAQRNGHDLAYGIGFLAWGVAAVACLLSWTVVAVQAARRLTPSMAWLRSETALAAVAAVCMVATTIATAVWWAALASSAPWALGDLSQGSGGRIVTMPLLLAGVLMAIGAGLGMIGAAHALRARGGLSERA